ncbi:MAG: type I restriction endonuclease subunit R [Opitutales bacterium]|nr:type I restriction endonuclease subunit R [Opitutales bacterium]
MNLYKEIHFESEICAHLGAHGWLYEEGEAQRYDRERALFPADVVAWVEATQPEAWKALVKNHGPKAADTLLGRVRDQIEQRGTLDVLRQGVELLGLRKPLQLAQFKPSLGMNPAIIARYEANRLRVVRQVRYARHAEKSLDLVLFLNGIPVATAELKSDFTQSVDDAIDQYRFDRLPNEKGHAAERLLSFPSGALVHFAVSGMAVAMCTRLDGPLSRFLPFNRGDDGGKGNPPNPGGHRTAYLWEEVWEREGWLEILGRYIIAQRDKKKRVSALIFPRYHQLDVTRKLIAAVTAEGAGGRYLVQHSAGSGKTNSIAWAAHFLAELHDTRDRKVFDTVLVVSDRTVIDTQLQEALFDFQRQTGVVATIKGREGSKSTELAAALSGDKKIVVCTVQTFPFALEKVRELAATEGKRFAVLADEAHSSQTGSTAAELKAVLSPEEVKELEDGGEIGTEDLIAAQMAARADTRNITFLAFTATPKNKTLELFGTRPDPARPAGPDNLPAPFHVYSMRQAIEEGFILDVLQNYTSYNLAFRLTQEAEGKEDSLVERGPATRKVMGWVRLHPYNISQKVRIVVEHFREQVAPLLKGQAKAMVVVGSRVEAVRWKLAIEKYIKEKHYGIGTLVAFSGEVRDAESGPDPFTEHSKTLNPLLKGRDIREAFKEETFQILLVANKFQTGFDQPLLCGMYVDKRLAGIQAVQTLSRLNRAHPGKSTTYVLDFVNEPAEVLKSFQTYHATAELAGTTDPNLVFNLRALLDAEGHYDENEVDRVVAASLRPGATQSELAAAIDPVRDRLIKSYKLALVEWQAARAEGNAVAEKAAREAIDALILFKRNMGTFLRVYTFLSQIFDYGNTAIEKRARFFRLLLPLLEFGREREAIDLSKVKLTHHNLVNEGKQSMYLGGAGPKIKPLGEAGSGEVREPEKLPLDAILEKINELFEGNLTDNDKLIYVQNVIMGKLLESRLLQQQASNNSKEQFGTSPDLMAELNSAIIDALDAHNAMSRQALNSDEVRLGLRDILLNHVGLWEELRKRAG